MGRPSIGDKPMTPAERQRRRRERLKEDAPLLKLVRVWKSLSKKQRPRFLRALRAETMLLKAARREAKELQLAEWTARQNGEVFVRSKPPPPRSALVLAHRARVNARRAALRADAALLVD
jgi:hypothetical protein